MYAKKPARIAHRNICATNEIVDWMGMASNIDPK